MNSRPYTHAPPFPPASFPHVLNSECNNVTSNCRGVATYYKFCAKRFDPVVRIIMSASWVSIIHSFPWREKCKFSYAFTLDNFHEFTLEQGYMIDTLLGNTARTSLISIARTALYALSNRWRPDAYTANERRRERAEKERDPTFPTAACLPATLVFFSSANFFSHALLRHRP